MASAIWLTEYMLCDSEPIRRATRGAKSERDAIRMVARKYGTYGAGLYRILFECGWRAAAKDDDSRMGIIVTDRLDVHYLWRGRTYAWFPDGMRKTLPPDGMIYV